MKPVHQVLLAAGLLIIGAVTWRIITLPQPQAAWLAVEAPDCTAPGETITLRIRLTDPDPGLQLVADLHGWTRHNRPLRVVSHARPQAVGTVATARDFRFRVPELPDLATVRAIIYLSPTGRWSERIHVATSDEIPVKPASGSTDRGELHALPAHELVPDPVIPRVESPTLRHLFAGLWLLVGGALLLRRRHDRQTPAPTTDRPARPALIAACLAVALAEMLQAEQRVGDAARRVAQQLGFYDERLLAQQVTVLFLAVGAAALAAFIIFRARHQWLVLGLLLHTATALVATLSMHASDALLYATILGQPVEQLAKIVAVGLAVWSLPAAFSRSALDESATRRPEA